MSGQYIPGDVVIDLCTISSSDGQRKLDIRPQVTMINIYEAITQPVVVGEIDIFDAIGLLGGFPLLGEEIIDLKFTTPGRDSITFKFAVTKISNVVLSPNIKGKSYVLHIASRELMTSVTTLIERRVKGNISDEIASIVSNELASSKPFVEMEPTIGIENYLLSKVTALEAIDKLRHRSISATNKSSSYCFFETSKGFSFITLEKLINQNIKNMGDRAFFYDETKTIDFAQVTFRNIINIEFVQQQDTLSNIRYGGISNNVKRFNLITGEMEDVSSKASKLDDKFQKTGPIARTNTTAFLAQHQRTTSTNMLFPDGTGDQSLHAEKLGVLSAFVEKMLQNILRVYVYGDTNITAGDVVNCNISTATGMTSKEKTTRTNNYIVAKARHIILNSARPNYTQSYELISNGFEY
jgi:hypothetical protein